MSSIRRVLIVGAGMAGLSLAIALRRQGLAPEIIERQSSWPLQGAGIYLVGNAMRALESLGVANAVLRAGAANKTQTVMNQRGKKLLEIDVERIWANCAPCVGVQRKDLQQILVNTLGDVQVRFATELAGLEQGDAQVLARFSDGLESSYDLVVGADGIRSSVRTLIFGQSRPRFCGQVAWRFLARCPASINGWTLFAGKSGAFLLIPVGNGMVYAYCDALLSRPMDDPVQGRLERLKAFFADYADPVQEVLAQLSTPEQVHFGAIEDILQQPWSLGRALLIGDAAHAASPNMASGAAMAFEDALVLSELIASKQSAAAVIEAYTLRRSPRILWLHEQTRQRDRVRKLPTTLRDLLFRFAGNRAYRANYASLLAPL